MLEERGFGRWYHDKQGDTGDLWHRTLIDPGLFRLLGPLAPGSRVLDVGCGNGYLARRLARSGSVVVGVDASAELIAAARASEEREPLGVLYHLTDAAHAPMLADGSFDVAVSNMALIDIEGAEGAIAEVGRVLRPGGRFVFTISHPCFDVDTRSAWVVEASYRQPPAVFRKVTGYRTPHAEEYRWPLGAERQAVTVGYHRPLAWYLHALRRAGLVVVDVDEPSPTEGFDSPQRAWIEEIPLHLVVEARREPTTS
jgi:SAM-dependent methyltransferase